jgi:acetyl-CoA C-acetyltransferase
MHRVFVLSAVRSPIGRRGGSLAEMHPGELLGDVLAAGVRAAGIPDTAVDQVLAGCVNQVGDQAYNVGRIAWLTSGLSADVPATTLDAQCGSSHQSVNLGAALLAAGAAEVVVAGGVEAMSRHPLGSNVEGGDGEPMGTRYRERFEVTTQGEAAERIADSWGIDRAECDAIALASQERSAAAWTRSYFAEEVQAVQLPTADGRAAITFERDETFRATTVDSLANLRPVFRPDGCLTAGNSSQISDGAACLVLASEPFVLQHGLSPLAEICGQAFVAVDPVLKLTGPIPATRKLLDSANLRPSDIDHFEVNEAFASVVGAWCREIEPPMDRVNPVGGAIALGHPVGATGARLCTTLVHALRRRGGGRGVVTMCCGGGLGTATLIHVD